ncbi:MAG TPA: hypothetical protein VJ957_12525 [Longimicrobiales bacterium]|nr:hypothetical protein [Longimicrobiales bacterium]
MSEELELKFALLADHVTETREGKLVIVGEFDTIAAPSAPVTHAPMYLVARLEATDADELENHAFRLGLFTDDGREIVPLSPPNPLRLLRTGPGRLRGQVIVQLGAVTFPEFGVYEFRLVVDEAVLARPPVHVIRVERPRSSHVH